LGPNGHGNHERDELQARRVPSPNPPTTLWIRVFFLRWQRGGAYMFHLVFGAFSKIGARKTSFCIFTYLGVD